MEGLSQDAQNELNDIAKNHPSLSEIINEFLAKVRNGRRTLNGYLRMTFIPVAQGNSALRDYMKQIARIILNETGYDNLINDVIQQIDNR